MDHQDQGASIAGKDGDALVNAYTHHNVQEDKRPFLSEMMRALTARRGNLKDKPLNMPIVTASALLIIARRTCSMCREDKSKHPHRKLCEAVITALHDRTAPTVFPMEKAHRGQILNGQADAEAEEETNGHTSKPVGCI